MNGWLQNTSAQNKQWQARVISTEQWQACHTKGLYEAPSTRGGSHWCSLSSHILVVSRQGERKRERGGKGDRVVTGHHFKNLRKTPTRTATDGAYFAPESTPSAPRALIAAAKCHMMYSARSAVSVTSAEGSNLNHRNLKKVSNPS